MEEKVLEIKEKYLPVGTVVMLKGGKKRVMVIGFATIGGDKKEYDYSGCLYPEGVITSDKTLLFNHDQIDKVYYYGLEDNEQKEFNIKLKDVVQKVHNGELKVTDEPELKDEPLNDDIELPSVVTN